MTTTELSVPTGLEPSGAPVPEPSGIDRECPRREGFS